MINIRKLEKKEKGKIQISLDNGMSCLLYRTELAALRSEGVDVTEGGELTSQQYDFLMKSIVGKRAKKRAMFLLEQQDRSEQQLREKLEKSEYPRECIDGAIEYVKSFHYLDDRRFAEHFIRYSREKMSRRQLEIKLMQKGIGRSDILNALDTEYPQNDSDRIEGEQIQKLLLKRRYDPNDCDEREFQRTYAYLMRRGFSSGKVLSAMKKCD